MSGAPVLRSASLQRALAQIPTRGISPSPTRSGGTFANTLAQAQVPAGQTRASVASAWTAASRLRAAAPTPRSTNAQATTPADALAPVDASTIPYRDDIVAAARRHGIDPALLAAVVKQESNFNPHARSAVGAKGLTQLMDATARGLGVSDPFDAAQALDGGAKFLSGLLKQFGGDTSRAIAAYNAGPAAVKRFGGIPPYAETQRYVPRVLANYDSYARSGAFA
ncbi:MAG: hypothetical protein NVSMB2_14400 [Chloroflexota bacterium]